MAAEWFPGDTDQEGAAVGVLGERVRELRKEHGWSQAALGQRIGTDSHRISRYENGHITPSVDALVKLADALEVTVDYLVREGVPRQNLDGHELGALGGRLAELSELSDEDRAALLNVLDGLLAKSRLKALAGGIA